MLFILLGVAAAAAPAEPSAPELRVLSFNIRTGTGMDGKRDLARIAKVITSQRPDVVMLQEVDKNCTRSGNIDQPAELARLTGMRVTFGAAMPFQGGEYGQAILSRTALSDPQIHRLPGPGEPRIALAATTVTRLGTLTVATVHLDFGAAQTAQAVALAKALESSTHPVILGGDFNAAPDAAALQPFTKAPWTLVPKSPPVATYPADKPRTEIDHFVLRGLRAAGPATVTNEPMASDHRPVLVTVTADR